MSLGPLTKVEVTLSPGAIAELEELVFFAARPVQAAPKVVGYYDRRGKLRRIVARYPDGCRAQVNIDANGFVTSARGSMSLTAKIGDANG